MKHSVVVTSFIVLLFVTIGAGAYNSQYLVSNSPVLSSPGYNKQFSDDSCRDPVGASTILPGWICAARDSSSGKYTYKKPEGTKCPAGFMLRKVGTNAASPITTCKVAQYFAELAIPKCEPGCRATSNVKLAYKMDKGCTVYAARQCI